MTRATVSFNANIELQLTLTRAANVISAALRFSPARYAVFSSTG